MGNTISHNVEMSGRPSSHVNILDALDAVDLVMQSHLSTSFVTAMATTADTDGSATYKEQLNNNITAAGFGSNPITSMGRGVASFNKIVTPWESLAEFAFGPNWYIEGKKREEQNQKNLASADESDSKQSKSFADGLLSKNTDTTAPVTVSATENETAEKVNETKNIPGTEHPQQYWYAPYVDVVPYYPIMQKVKRVGSIPVNLRNESLQQQQQQLEFPSSRDKMEEQARVAEARINSALRSIPDTKYWGVPSSISEINMNGEKEQEDEKMGDDTTALKKADSAQQYARDSSKIYPFFLPPLPPAYTYKFSSSSLKGMQPAEDNFSSRLTDSSVGNAILSQDEELLKDSSVRSSLVKFGDDDGGVDDDYYWGGGKKRRKIVDDTLVVPKGLSIGGTSATTTSSSAPTPQLLIRPSSNRANRILEGSMDAS